MKNKIAILTDTNSGLSPEWVELYGIYMVPMPVVINNETYFEHQSIDQNEFFTRLRQGASVRTSQPTPHMLMEIWEKLLEKKEHISIIIDEYGSLRGIVTLEDVIETMLGFEIVDEKDEVVDMQELAKEQWQQVQNRQRARAKRSAAKKASTSSPKDV